MKLNYFPDTDSLYIDLSHRPSGESQEVSEGVVLDYDGEGNLVGIDIDHASRSWISANLSRTTFRWKRKREFFQQSTFNVPIRRWHMDRFSLSTLNRLF